MKNLVSLIFLFVGLAFMVSSCGDCQGVDCQNGGSCNEGECDCLHGYSGENCDVADFCILLDRNCLNGGVCLDGECDCPTGFEGTDCEIVSRQRFLGNYNGLDRCDDGDTTQHSFSIEAHPIFQEEIYIRELWNQQFVNRVRATANDYQLTIKAQKPDFNEFEIKGSGRIDTADNFLIINYTITNTNNGDVITCKASVNRQP